MILYVCIAPGRGRQPQGTNFDVNRKALSLYPFAASFEEISLKSDFIHFFHDLIHVYSRGRQLPRDTALMSTEMFCHFIHLLPVSKQCL